MSMKFSTTLHCQGCLQRLKPYLENEPSISKWEMDLKSEDKILTVEGSIPTSKVISILEEAGFKGEIYKANPLKFWSDGPKWNRASFNTLNCLLGCSIGDFGMVIYLQYFHSGISMTMQMILATIMGLCTSVLLETILLKKRESMNWNFAFKTALSMSFISMIAMELAMNITDFMITGNGTMSISDYKYWLAFIPAAIAGFLAPLPYNYFKLKKYNKACH